MIRNLTESFDFNAQALLLRSERGRVLASNVANADTPNFKARDFNFAQTLQQATGSATNAHPLRTHASHLASPVAAGQPTLMYRTPLQSSLDGNSVDMDMERAAFADNTARYEASLRFINGQIRTLMLAMGGQGG